MESTKERIRLEEPGQRGHKSPKEIQENVDSFKETECKPLNVVSFELKHGLHEKYIVECHKYDKKKLTILYKMQLLKPKQIFYNLKVVE